MNETLHEAVDANFEDYQLAWTERLVNQPSHTYAPEDVEAAAALLDEAAEALGLATRCYDPRDERFGRHRVYTAPGVSEGRKSIALVGHIDTVFPRSTGFLRYSREDALARGPGVLDMKSGLMLILSAMRAIRDVSPEVFGRLETRFICVSDEEVGAPSSRRVYEELAPSIREALVFEMGRHEDRIVTTRKGGGTFRLEAKGRNAHSGNAHAQGLNAIHALALKIDALESITDYERGVTINVGLIEGGTSKNTVPNTASCVIDARCITAEDAAEMVARLEAVAAAPLPEGVRGNLREATFSLTGGITRPPMEPSAATQALRARYEPHASAVGLGIGEAPRQGGFSDANILVGCGVPTIDGIGGSGKGAHSSDEQLDLVSLRRRTKALATYLWEAHGG